METVKLGSKGEDVKKLQTILGISPADGIFGKGTDAKVKEYQKSKGLKEDGVVGPKTWELLCATQNVCVLTKEIGNGVVYAPISKNISIRKGTIKYIVVHYTAGSTSKEGTAMRNVKMFDGDRPASADIVIDDTTIVQANPDPVKFCCWAVGDKGDGRQKTIFNSDCISIEVCSSLMKGTSFKVPNHDGWYFTDMVIDKLLYIVPILMEKYNIPFENVIRHFDVTGKMCPGLIGWNTGMVYDSKTEKPTKVRNNESKWIEFKEKLYTITHKEDEIEKEDQV